jgi:hypothetical protein
MRATRPAYIKLLNSVMLMILYGDYKQSNFSLCNFIQPALTSSYFQLISSAPCSQVIGQQYIRPILPVMLDSVDFNLHPKLSYTFMQNK